MNNTVVCDLLLTNKAGLPYTAVIPKPYSKKFKLLRHQNKENTNFCSVKSL